MNNKLNIALFLFLATFAVSLKNDSTVNDHPSRGPSSSDLITGFNIAWIGNNYGHQFTTSFSKTGIIRELDLAKEANVKMVRMWFFEGKLFQQFDLDKNGVPLKLKAEFIPNIIFFLQEAKKRNLKVNFTFFDANAFPRFTFKNNAQVKWWRDFFNQRNNVTKDFFEKIMTPLFHQVHKAGLMKVIAQADLVNEMDYLVNSTDMFKDRWKSAGFLLCNTHDYFKALGIKYSTSVGHHGASRHIFNGDIPPSCVDYFDLHLYNDDGKIPNCSKFQDLANQGVELQLGEFGQKKKTLDYNFQAEVTKKFLQNAKHCGFRSALAWKLDDSRDRPAVENKLSFVDGERPRPAYYIVKEFK